MGQHDRKSCGKIIRQVENEFLFWRFYLKTKLILGGIVIMAVVLYVASQIPSDKKDNTKIFHVRLADPKLYDADGIFSETFTMKNGTYKFRFVSSGDSPTVLSILLKGDSFSFYEDFKLNGTLQEPGTYYTWKYLGQEKIYVPNEQNIEIKINPNGNLLGPVSIFLEKLDV